MINTDKRNTSPAGVVPSPRSSLLPQVDGVIAVGRVGRQSQSGQETRD